MIKKLILWTFILNLIITILSLLQVFNNKDYYNNLKRFTYGLLNIIVLSFIFGIIVYLIKNKHIKKIFNNLIISTVLIVTFIEISLYLNFNTLISSSTMTPFFETNSSEAMEFISMYFNKNIIIICLIFVILFFIDKYYWKYVNINFYKYRFILLFLIVISSIISLSKNRFRYNSFSRIYISYKATEYDIKAYKNLQLNIKKNTVNILKNNSSIKNVILVIGESTSRNHMSLYNYPLETNPNLKKLETQGNLYKFTDVISPHCYTVGVLKELLTYKNLESKFSWKDSDNLVDIMKAAGYKTKWISNQESFGLNGNFAAAIGSRSDQIIFNKIRNSNEEFYGLFDEQLLSKFKANDSEKEFIVLHLMGAHGKYSNRYPKSWNKFNEKTNSSKFDKKTVSEYDNAILYNDYVINELYNKVKNTESLIIYLSDHGEDVYNSGNNLGHGESKGNRYMVEIPFIFIATNKFKAKYPNKIKQIKNSLNKPYMTDDTIHTILDICGIKTADFKGNRSIINEKFNQFRKRITYGKDYIQEKLKKF